MASVSRYKALFYVISSVVVVMTNALPAAAAERIHLRVIRKPSVLSATHEDYVELQLSHVRRPFRSIAARTAYVGPSGDVYRTPIQIVSHSPSFDDCIAPPRNGSLTLIVGLLSPVSARLAKVSVSLKWCDQDPESRADQPLVGDHIDDLSLHFEQALLRKAPRITIATLAGKPHTHEASDPASIGFVAMDPEMTCGRARRIGLIRRMRETQIAGLQVWCRYHWDGPYFECVGVSDRGGVLWGTITHDSRIESECNVRESSRGMRLPGE